MTMPGTRSATEPIRPIIGSPRTTSSAPVARDRYSAWAAISTSGQVARTEEASSLSRSVASGPRYAVRRRCVREGRAVRPARLTASGRSANASFQCRRSASYVPEARYAASSSTRSVSRPKGSGPTGSPTASAV